MTFFQDFDPRTRVLHTRFTGKIGIGEVISGFRKAAEMMAAARDFIHVIHLDQVKDISASYEALRPLEEVWKRYADSGPRWTLVYAPSDIGFGTFRMIQSFLETREERVDLTLVRTPGELKTRLEELQA